MCRSISISWYGMKRDAKMRKQEKFTTFVSNVQIMTNTCGTIINLTQLNEISGVKPVLYMVFKYEHFNEYIHIFIWYLWSFSTENHVRPNFYCFQSRIIDINIFQKVIQFEIQQQHLM